jgi:hypothetical protein
MAIDVVPSHVVLQKLKCVYLEDGGRKWFLNGKELPHVVATPRPAFTLLEGKRAHVTLTLEVELELAEEDAQSH